MNIKEYQALAQRTSTDDHDKLLNGCLGLMGEAGEVVDVIKKWMFQSGDNAPLPREKLIDELGDVTWYCGEVCAGLESSVSFIYSTEYGNIGSRHTIDGLAALLAAQAAKPWHAIYGEPLSPCGVERRREIALDHVREILSLVDQMSRRLCSSLDEVMEKNIEKLRRRYPDGFDPKKSLHRAE